MMPSHELEWHSATDDYMCRLGYTSEGRRIRDRNIWTFPDTSVLELTLNHRAKHGKSTVVQFRSVWANSFSSAAHLSSHQSHPAHSSKPLPGLGQRCGRHG